MAVDYNQTKPSNFYLVINDPDSEEVKSVNFFIQNCPIPGITAEATQINYNSVTLSVNNNHITFEPFSFNLIINESWDNYKYFYDWIIRCKMEENVLVEAKDVTIHILDNEKIPIREFTIEKSIPVSLGAVSLDYTDTEVQSVVVPITLAHQWLHLEFAH